jgi:hypothetical protein
LKSTLLRISVLNLLLFLQAFPVSAEIPLDKYGDIKESVAFKTYISGVAEGIRWSNVAVQSFKHDTPFLCPPAKLALTQDNYIQILDDYITKHDVKSLFGEDGPLEFILLMALLEVFPCQQKTDAP